MQKISKEQFVKEYAGRSGLTEEEFFAEYNEIAMPCDCDYEECQGWRMVPNDPLRLKIYHDLYAPREA